jgi:ribosomal protein S16
MLLDATKIKSLGWKPKLNSQQASGQTAKDLIQTGAKASEEVRQVLRDNRILLLMNFCRPGLFIKKNCKEMARISWLQTERKQT